MNLAQRSIISISWNIVATLVTIASGLLRTVLLARWLPVETFGVYAFADALVSLTVALPNFGMAGAFLHRTKETENEGQAAAVHFTLKWVFTSVWAVVIAVGALIFADGQQQIAVLVLVGATYVVELAQTPRLILVRRVMHKRLAVIQGVDALLSTIVALALAWQGATLWALLSVRFSTLIVTITGLYIWHPVWRPSTDWSPSTVRYFLGFGSLSLGSYLLRIVLDRIDDLWTGYYLNNKALGFYSRAYSFAKYPSMVFAQPINRVASGSYADLKGKRQALSRAFVAFNGALTRTSFFFGGILVLVAPELIRIALGTKWLSMVNTFRLMLLFTLLDPIRDTIDALFKACGAPQRAVMVRLVQLAVLTVGLFVLGSRLGIDGVALAVDLMVLVGIAVSLQQARQYVDISLFDLFGLPSVALAVGLAAGYSMWLAVDWASDLQSGFAKGMGFILAYLGVLFVLEREWFLNLSGMIYGLLVTDKPSLRELVDRLASTLM